MTYDASSSIKTPAIGTPAAWVSALTSHGAQDAERIVSAYFKYAALIGYNADLAIAQACLECNWFTDWKWTTNRSPAGIGSTSRDVPGNVFPSIEAGITAQLAHQAAYAESAASCPIEQLTGPEYATLFQDPRHLFHKATPAIGAWNGAWAVPGDRYAEDICAVANAVVGDVPPAPTPPTPGGTLNIIDLRGQLYRNPNGGPNASATARTGIVIHYNGPPPNPDAVTQYTNDAVYHANKDWGQGNYGDGIMYHWGIGSDGTAYQLRDEDAALWHCGTQENYTALSINVNIGDGLHATPAQIATLTTLCDEKRAQYGIALERTFGHQELSPTSCPGTLMADFIYPYRDGTIGGTNVTTAFKDPVTGKLVANAMLDFFTNNGGVAVLGRPVTNEVSEEWPDDPNGSPKRTVQCFERDILAFFPENKDPYRVQALRLGAKWAQQRGYQGPGIDPPPKPLPNPMGGKERKPR